MSRKQTKKKPADPLTQNPADVAYRNTVRAVRIWLSFEHPVCRDFRPARLIEVVEYDTDGSGNTLAHFSGTDDNPYTAGDLRALGLVAPEGGDS